MTSTCPDCHRLLSSAIVLAQHREKYCRYRGGKKAKRPVVARHRIVVDDEDEIWAADGECYVVRTNVSANGRARDFTMEPSEENVTDVERWLTNEVHAVEELLERMKEFLVKGRLVLKAWYVKRNPATFEVLRRELFYLSSLPADFVHNFQHWYNRHTRGIIKNLETFAERDSDLQFESIEALDIKLNLLTNLSGRSFFKLPEKLNNMKAVVNVDCEDSCFKYALLSILHYEDVKEHRNRCSNYKRWLDELNFGDINPSAVEIKDVAKIEKLNNIKINIHVWDGELQSCRYNNPKVIADKTVNLLLVVGNDGERHYCGIPSLSRLYRHTKTAHNMQHMCDRCIRSFKTKEVLEQHYQACVHGRLQIEQLPKHTKYSYNAFHKELCPVKVIYSDIESFIHEDTHYPAAISSYEVWHSDLQHIKQNTTQLKSWNGEECIVDFLTYIDQTAQAQHRYDNKMTRRGMNLSTQQQQDFDACTNCPRCKSEFNDTTHKKVRDHDHITGSFRSALCHKCNSKLHLSRRTLPVIFHNFKNYDCHQLLKHGIDKFKHWQLDIIPQTKEKYMTLKARIPVETTRQGKLVYFNVVFLDSYQFMSSSLASLVNNLDNLPFTEVLQRDYPNLTNETIKRKGVFPYSYFNSLSKLQESSLPPRSAFRNDLSGEECTEEDYRFAQTAWREFDCQTFGDYLMVYLKLDVLLLACVFERFQSKTLEQDGLDPVHFVSLPGLSFLSAFKMTGETIELLNDLEMYSFFERGIRGGMTFVNTHHLHRETSTQHATHLAYIDENNLYGNALSKPLPHSEFSWVEDLSVFTRDFILALDEDGERGYTFEVDLGYPQHLHDRTVDFPLAPETGEITHDMFSPFMKDFYEQLNPNTTYKSSEKLLLTQYNREHYIVHFAALKFYLKMGLTLDKVHRVIKYKQKAWLKEYINYNSQQRAKSSNDFDKSFYKLKNNALFGKTMEGVRKRINYKLITDEEKFDKLARSPYFHDRDIITQDLVGVHMLKAKVTLDKPIFVGQAVLDYSKIEMYNLFYSILPHCPLIKKLHLAGGDTDSFFLTISTDKHITLSDVFNNLAQHMDTSNYPSSHPLYSTVNKAKLGCFKDETAGQTLEEMILLRPKMYSMKYKDTDTSIKRAKGISKHLVKNMRHDRFKEVYEEKKISHVQMTIIRSQQHTVQTTTFNKRALSAWEDKRCWLNENFSLPHGHMDCPVPMPKRRRVQVPESGDVSD